MTGLVVGYLCRDDESSKPYRSTKYSLTSSVGNCVDYIEMYVIIARQHTKIKEVALVHIV